MHQIRNLPSFFWPQFHSGSQFLGPPKSVVSCDLFIVIIIIIIIITIVIHFFRLVFSECTLAIATSLIPLDTILHEIYAFIINCLSCTVWTKMRSLAGSLADGVLADAILISPCSPIPPTNIRMVRGPRQKTGN